MNLSKPTPKRSRGLILFLLKLGLAGVSVLLVCGFFEVGMRMAGFQAIYEIYSKPSALWRHDPLLGWSHEPNSEDTFIGPRPWPVEFETDVRINSLGLRGPEVPPRVEDDHRLLFLGDSMVAAFEVDYEKTFPALVGESLSRRLERDVRAINAGVRGYGTDQSLLYYRDRGKLLDPDVVVFFHSRNDLVNNRTIHRMRRLLGKPAFAMDESRDLSLVGFPVPDYPVCTEYFVDLHGTVRNAGSFLSRWLCQAQMMLFDRSALLSFLTLRIDWDPDLLRSLYYLAIPNAHEEHAEFGGPEYARQLTLALLSELSREVKASGAELLITGDREQLLDLGLPGLRETGAVLQPLGSVEPERKAALHYERDSHFNELGHMYVAEHLIPPVEKLLIASESIPSRSESNDLEAEQLR